MSTLRLFSPTELSICSVDDAEVTVEGAEAPVILSFPSRATLPSSQYRAIGLFRGSRALNEPLERARQLHKNRHCPCCQRGGVIPREEFALAKTSDCMPTPGAGRLTGFDCRHCGHEWGVV
ncbi:MAG: hypothetical protein NT069_04740 [Planctomycetota bacterium]|nr:hypothetical protein [Planctomycetota bacterium]